MSRNRDGLLLVLLGAVVGALAALLAATDEKGETKPVVKEKLKGIKDKAKEEAEVIKEIFGKYSEELARLYNQAREDLDKRMKKLKVSFDEIDKKKYQDLVDDVMVDIKKGTDATRRTR